MKNIKKKIENYIRVLKLLKMPTKEEYYAALKISGIGILLVGLVGYLVWLLFHLLMA